MVNQATALALPWVYCVLLERVRVMRAGLNTVGMGLGDGEGEGKEEGLGEATGGDGEGETDATAAAP